MTDEASAPSRGYRTYFQQDCVICGRPLCVEIEFLGAAVACHDCGGESTALDASVRVNYHQLDSSGH